MRELQPFSLLLWLAATVVLFFFALPVIMVVTQSTPGHVFANLRDPVAVDALTLSLKTSLSSILLTGVFGTCAAWFLALRKHKRIWSAAVTFIELPLVLPPAVAGIALLVALGPHSMVGRLLDDAGLQLVLSSAGVVVAMTFVSAPLYLRQAIAAFSALDKTQLDVARCFGAGERKTLFLIAIPTVRKTLLAGLVVAWARAVGEFGATLMFAGSFRGVTQTLPLAIYAQFTNDFSAAISMSVLMICLSAAVLLSTRLIGERNEFKRVET